MRDEELDRIIDAGLSTYAEPRARLEQRVMAAVAAKEEEAHIVLSQVSESRRGAPKVRTNASGERERARPAWRMWAVGLAAAACLLIAITVGVRRVEAPQPHNQEAVNSTPAPVVSPPAALEVRQEPAVRVGVKRRTHRSVEARWPRLPKKAVFPTPQPLSPELQALARFVARAPEAQQKQFIDAQAKLDAPIKITPLQIAPLKESDEDEH